ncbi:flagellar motor switch protein FliG [Paracoccus pacificus]|uniref:Flagellar motor switch protein FliG n=1 Tax=Paracoccus pacificus TaxID=1463598 RepID=A0ABW4R2G8_9RHOB
MMKLIGGHGLTPPQKAAVIVRLLLAEGGDLPLATLPPELQASLAHEMAQMDMIDRETRDAIVSEFCDTLEQVGLSFPGGMDGALDLLGGHLSADTTNRLRRLAAIHGRADPWLRVAAIPVPQLRQIAETEAVEVAAVLFSKLPVPLGAEVLGQIRPERARQIAYAMSLTGNIDQTTLRRIGLALMQALDALPQSALDAAPVDKVGAILNFTPSVTRDTVLAGLDIDDRSFATEVRKAIFTWANIPIRIDPKDMSKILRGIDTPVLLRAMAGSKGENLETVGFILANISPRMAESIREELAECGKPSEKETDEAMATVVAAIRRLEEAGEIFLIAGEPEAE